MTAKLDQFALELDILLGLHPGSAAVSDDTALKIASLLVEMNLDAGTAPQPELRARWISHTRSLNPQRSTLNLFARKWAWVAAPLLVLALLIAFRQPVFAAVGRLFGYIYLQDSGFLPADSTFVLAQPVVQSHDGRSLLVLRGVSTPRETVLTLEYSDISSPADGAQLETTTGEVIPLSWWEYSPNAPGSHGVRLHFPALPSGMTQTTLVLPEGWRLPLAWIPASQSGLPDVQVIPYPGADAATPSPADACVEKNGMELCVQAATTTSEATSILVGAQSTHPDLHPGNIWQGLVWQTETEPVTLRDAQGKTLPMDGMQGDTLLFSPLSGGQQVTLTVPALLAGVNIPEQTIVVDMGSDPQPETVIPLDVSIQVLDMTVHFSRATFIGDGVNSLRLTLNTDPVQAVNGLTPAVLEIGKPDRVDDLYGTGMLTGSKDIFIELVRPHEKITGTITIPVVGATVIVDGPFEFTFALPDAVSMTSTPVVADPNAFSPAPTPTLLSLDSYTYSGQPLQSGDLLFTAINRDNTDVYVFTPNVDSRPRLLATLPGAIAQVYVHPDRQGLDYLAGSHEIRDDFSYIDNIRLYTLHFDEGRPRLLYSFAPNSENLVGTSVEGSWSFDGRYAVFRYDKPTPGASPWKFLWIDMSCTPNEDCVPHEIVLDQELELYKAYFAPADYRIVFTGSDTSGTGEPDLFLLDFDPTNPTTNIVNITANSSSLADDVGVSPAVWAPDGSIFTLCTDRQAATMFCSVDPENGNIVSGAIYKDNIARYQLSASGKQVLGVVINHNATGKGILEIHLFDLDGNAGPALATGRMFDVIEMSPSEQYLAYVPEYANDLDLIDLLSGKTTQVYTSNLQWTISWAGWVR